MDLFEDLCENYSDLKSWITFTVNTKFILKRNNSSDNIREGHTVSGIMLITADNAKWHFEHHYPTPSSKYTNCISDQTLVTRPFQTP